jgi:AAA domain
MTFVDTRKLLAEVGAENLRQIPADEPPPPSGLADYGLPEASEIEHQDGVARSNGHTGEPPARFAPIAIDDIESPETPEYLISGLVPVRGLICVVGAPKSRKSYFTSDMFFSVARGVPYGGRATLQGPVIYATGEGVAGFKRRLIAMRRHHGVEGQGIPFFMIENVPDLGSEKTDLHVLLHELDSFFAAKGLPPPRAIVLDTVARCMGEGDENAAKDMGRFVRRCGQIERHFDCLVAVVHHTGKDPTRGGRGSNSLNGGADVTMLVEKSEAYSTVRVEEMKDGLEGQEWRFRLVPYDESETWDTRHATAGATIPCVVELLSEPTLAQPRATKTTNPPSGVAGDLLKVIRRAIEEAGEISIGSAAVPNNVRTISRATLKRYCITMDWQNAEGAPHSFRTMLSKTLSQLRARDRISFDREWVWLT